MEAVQKGELKMICPYNPSHYIRRLRMECHLVKCRKSYDGKCKLVECDFNTCHRIPEPELQYHHEICPDKKLLEVALIAEEEVCPLAPKPAPRVEVPCDDSWDGPTVASYDPQKYCQENNVLRRLDTASAAVRRDFRVAERQRVEEINKQKRLMGVVGNNINQGENRIRPENIELPPTPQFRTSIEPTPIEIQRQMQELKLRSIRRPVAVIPKSK